jgi:energy-coupling factor transport system substrate-specific component
MIAAGWVGLTAGWLPRNGGRKGTLILLTTFAFCWGLLFGFILNLYFWPFIDGEASLTASERGGFLGTAGRYGAFYLTTSFAWDLVRGLGNALLMFAIGAPAIKALSRFRNRLRFEVT